MIPFRLGGPSVCQGGRLFWRRAKEEWLIYISYENHHVLFIRVSAFENQSQKKFYR